MKYLLYLRFLGTAYNGYQVQQNGPSIQAELNRATEQLFGYPCDIVGCSRTDSGVHAEHFCATIAAKGRPNLITTIPPERVPLAMNAYLPSDISVFYATAVDDTFHARYDVKRKEYCYRIYDDPIRDPFQTGRSLHWKKHLSDQQIVDMARASAYWIGTHDFRSYMSEGSKVTSTVRTVYSADVQREDNCVVFRITANGFLYNMVRIMTGTLLSVAEGKLSPDEIPAITDSLDRSRAGRTAPACGLYLHQVEY